jgi:alpha-L-fucosidase
VDADTESFWAVSDETGEAWIEVDLEATVPFDVIEIKEPIRYGQRVEAFRVEVWDGDAWDTIARGTTIGYKRLLRVRTVQARRVRLVIESARGSAAVQEFGLYGG